ncbi:DUF6236 family protein [Hyphomonas sp.]|uniref:DUF6236 family protein n=1 Tax=Hyphomonas sp. TaxID=87 RepID=UPI0025C2A87A|nr:DUF6236 family protein [Hyphomonas sp.]
MLGTALYHPTIDIRDSAWLKSAVLFWDHIQTIVPSEIAQPYRNTDAHVCATEGFLSPLHCDQHPEFAEELGTKILRLSKPRGSIRYAMQQVGRDYRNPSIDAVSSLARKLQSALTTRDQFGDYNTVSQPTDVMERISTTKLSPDVHNLLNELSLARMHPQKLPSFLRSQPRTYSDQDGEWLLVDKSFANSYMTALAAKLASKLSLTPLTSKTLSHGLSSQFLFEDDVDTTHNRASGALIDVAFRSLKVDPTTPISRLLKFRRRRETQFQELSIEFQNFRNIISEVESDEPIEKRAQQIYQTNIDPKMKALKKEASLNSIETVWDGAIRALTVSAPAGGALAVFSQLGTPVALGAGAAIAAIDLGVKSYLSGKKLKVSNPYSYLHDLENTYGLPRLYD